MPAVSDTACTTASFPAPRTWCFLDSEPCASSTAVSGTDMQGARTQRLRPLDRNSGRRSSTRTWSVIGATDATCLMPAGVSQSSGSVRCAATHSEPHSRWTSGCAEMINGSRRGFPADGLPRSIEAKAASPFATIAVKIRQSLSHRGGPNRGSIGADWHPDWARHPGILAGINDGTLLL